MGVAQRGPSRRTLPAVPMLVEIPISRPHLLCCRVGRPAAAERSASRDCLDSARSAYCVTCRMKQGRVVDAARRRQRERQWLRTRPAPASSVGKRGDRKFVPPPQAPPDTVASSDEPRAHPSHRSLCVFVPRCFWATLEPIFVQPISRRRTPPPVSPRHCHCVHPTPDDPTQRIRL